MRPALAIHGGAGTILRSQMTADLEREYRNGLEASLLAGWKVLDAGGSATDAVEAAGREVDHLGVPTILRSIAGVRRVNLVGAGLCALSGVVIAVASAREKPDWVRPQAMPVAVPMISRIAPDRQAVSISIGISRRQSKRR